MKRFKTYFLTAISFIALALLAPDAQAQAAYASASHAQTGATTSQPAAKKGGAVQTTAASLPVIGSGTIGRLTKWTGLTSSNSLIGDTTIFEDKYGMVGIGTDSPTSKLTIAGMVQITLGGLKFPDGTVQTTAGLGSISHDATLKGDGSSASPLSIALPLTLIGTSLNSAFAPLVYVKNLEKQFGFPAIGAVGGDTDIIGGFAGAGMVGVGGNGPTGTGGAGVNAFGGNGGDRGGVGVSARGGGPTGLVGQGGVGLRAQGGPGTGAGYSGGEGLFVVAGKGVDGGVDGSAAVFNGVVDVRGNFNVTGGGTKNFKIDHPLDPENKYLYHAAIESSEVLNIYSGNIKLDANGDATVKLPEWFEALNKDLRYSLTSIGAPGQSLYIAEEVSNNQFKIAGGLPGAKVSWQVTGIRSDAAILKRPFKVEEDKLKSERGYYLAPEAYGQPEERGIEWARNPQTMQQLKQERLETEQKSKQHKTIDR